MRDGLASFAVDFDLSPELSELQRTVRRLAQEKVKPRARQIDTTGEYPSDLFEAFRGADLLGLCLPTELGGSGAGILGLTIAIEEVAKHSNAAALMLLLTRLPVGPVLIAGNDDQKRRYLPGIADGSLRAAFGLSEPQAGSDVAGMRTRAVPDTG
ncbi:MAG: acyl-CoA dehydrogenase family protein, partial [Actinomycetota bacterium]|nr:acyl-CoA dehydrogenase family protein [Actinomycetota bacterium]